MYRKILVPFDSSDTARHALSEALELASCEPDCTVTIVSVFDQSDYNSETFKIAARMAGMSQSTIDASMLAAEDDDSSEVEALKKEVAPLVGDKGDIVSYKVVLGDPHDAITAYAELKGFDCIVMGHRGISGVRGMLGSVCYSVLHKTSIPVLIVR